MGAALWGGGGGIKIKNSSLVYYCIQNQNKHGKMSLNILKLSEKGLFGSCFQAELQTSWDLRVLRGTHSEQLRDADNLLSLVHCFGLNNFLVICFSLRTHPFPFPHRFSRLLPVALQAAVCLWLKCCDAERLRCFKECGQL